MPVDTVTNVNLRTVAMSFDQCCATPSTKPRYAERLRSKARVLMAADAASFTIAMPRRRNPRSARSSLASTSPIGVISSALPRRLIPDHISLHSRRYLLRARHLRQNPCVRQPKMSARLWMKPATKRLATTTTSSVVVASIPSFSTGTSKNIATVRSATHRRSPTWTIFDGYPCFQPSRRPLSAYSRINIREFHSERVANETRARVPSFSIGASCPCRSHSFPFYLLAFSCIEYEYAHTPVLCNTYTFHTPTTMFGIKTKTDRRRRRSTRSTTFDVRRSTIDDRLTTHRVARDEAAVRRRKVIFFFRTHSSVHSSTIAKARRKARFGGERARDRSGMPVESSIDRDREARARDVAFACERIGKDERKNETSKTREREREKGMAAVMEVKDEGARAGDDDGRARDWPTTPDRGGVSGARATMSSSTSSLTTSREDDRGKGDEADARASTASEDRNEDMESFLDESLFDALLPPGAFDVEPFLEGFFASDDDDAMAECVVPELSGNDRGATVGDGARRGVRGEILTSPATTAAEQETEEERKMRLARNKESAQNSRARKREYVRDLEKRARTLEAQNGELQALVMHLSNENHALRMGLSHMPSAMSPYMMPMYSPAMLPAPKLPLPPMSASLSALPLPHPVELQNTQAVHAPKRRKQTVVSAATALALGTLGVVALVSPQTSSHGRSAAVLQTSSVSRRRLLAISGREMLTEDHSTMLGVNITSLREEVTAYAERTYALPDKATVSGVALWDDVTSDGRAVDVLPGADVNDPWFSAFKAAGMTHVDLLSRVMCSEMFKFRPADTADAVQAKMTDIWEPQGEKYELKQAVSHAIPMLSGKENASDFPSSNEIDSNAVVSVLLPPPTKSTAGVMQQLNKVFVVTFNKRTTDYTTYSCLMPQPAHHV